MTERKQPVRIVRGRGPADPGMWPEYVGHTGQRVDLAKGEITTNDIEAEQDAIKRHINSPVIDELLSLKPQPANPDANATVFQPNAATVVGDMVTGPDPRGRMPAVMDQARPMLRDWPTDPDATFVQNAPEVGEEQ